MLPQFAGLLEHRVAAAPRVRARCDPLPAGTALTVPTPRLPARGDIVPNDICPIGS